jgi:cytochrome c5
MNVDGLEETAQGELEALSTATESAQHIDGDSSGEDRLLIFPTAELTLPSAGSDQHLSGTCRRCCFFPKGRCVNGTACEFCHYPHDKERNKTSKRTNHAKRREQRQQRHTNQQLASTVSAVPAGGSFAQLEDSGTGERIVKLRLQDAVIGVSQHLHGLLHDSSYVTCEVGPIQLARVGVQ